MEEPEVIEKVSWDKIFEFVARAVTSPDVEETLKSIARKNSRRMFSTMSFNEIFGVHMRLDTENIPTYLLPLLPPLAKERFIDVHLSENFAVVEFSSVSGGEVLHKLVVYKKVIQ